ncbi:hypothetical protein [Aquisalinus flavus]|uniref:Uncharacterized protein n=1 Tax=Aquisalinus flavus TaxID=1526572 RepID=A0A8J2V573_9PROT|nr:hypothetical protein [Aquisalinus flavus]MBD0426357.1 hypothetical protein [Aquisalinus flavus]UNE48077.1 erythromycin esterase family protein [Aquisalinus flavus]GGD08621.1 hypothetical protein GCM10011342_16800 [Aquisalinus flavus]
MKFILGAIKWLFLGLLGLVVVLAGWPWIAVLQDKLSEGSDVAYLERNGFSLDPLAEAPEFAFDDSFYDNRLFLFAEMHGYGAPQDFDFALLRHLNERAGVRYYLAELPPSAAFAFNHYLETGDDAQARQVFDDFAAQKAQWGNKEFFAKLEKIRALNMALPDDRKIWFIGVDYLTETDFAVTQGDLLAEQFAMAGEAGSSSRRLAVMALQQALLTQTIAANAQGASRYGVILANIETAMASDLLAGEKLYGMWGLFHGMETTVNGSRPLAMRLAELPAFQPGVVSLMALYAEGSLMMMPSAYLPEPARGPNGDDYVLLPANYDQTYLYYLRGIHPLKKATGDAPVGVFNLDGEGTPYAQGGKLVQAQGIITMMTETFDIEGSASEATDYAVLFQGSAPLTPWGGTAYDIAGALEPAQAD